jgi:hypothetical protein
VHIPGIDVSYAVGIADYLNPVLQPGGFHLAVYLRKWTAYNVAVVPETSSGDNDYHGQYYNQDDFNRFGNTPFVLQVQPPLN